MLALAWALLVAANVAGVADSSARFEPVPEPPADRRADSCGDDGEVGRWVRMASDGAAASVNNWGWLDSAMAWNGTRLVVSLRKNGKWSAVEFDPCRNSWSPPTEIVRVTRSEPWLADGNDRPFRPSHRDGSFDSFERLSVWDGARNAWALVTAARDPLTPRAHYAVALAGRRLLVWGGWTRAARALDDGAVLDIPRNVWKRMSSAGAPSARIAPAVVVWTGKRLVVWGGRAPTTVPGTMHALGDGAQYDPAADRWTPMSSQDAPGARADATVAWTGRKVVVVGGSEQFGGPPLPGGGIYDPASNRWQHLDPAPAGVVLPRGNTGPLTRVMVARDGRLLFVPDGAGQVVLLDADRAAWSVIDAAPLGKRTSFRAFLIGRRLIVWGGQTVIAQHICPPPVPGQPICDSFAETAAHNDGWMIQLP